jgi:hypothetical protein
MLYNLYFLSLIITLIVCLYTYKQLDRNFKWFPPYLSLVIIVEIASMRGLLIINHTNAWCNNNIQLMEFVLFTYFVSSFRGEELYKKKVYYLAAIIIVISLIDMFFIQGIWRQNTIALILQELFLLTLICIYYYDLLAKADERIVLLRHPPFLAATGLFFYFLSNAAFYSCYSYMAYKNSYHFLILARTIPGISNLLLNSLLISAFLCFSKTKKLSL